MAYIEITGIDEVMARLADEESDFRGRVTRALEMAAGELREQLQREEQSSFVAPTGELGATIGWDGVSFGVGAARISVYAKGSYKGSRGGTARRAGLVAAMVEYRHGNPWNRRAREAGEGRINSILQEMLGIGQGGVGYGWGGR